MLRCVVENAPMLGGIRESLGRRPLVDVHTKNVVPLHTPARVGTCARKYRRHCASGRRCRGRTVHAERANESLRCVVKNAMFDEKSARVSLVVLL